MKLLLALTLLPLTAQARTTEREWLLSSTEIQRLEPQARRAYLKEVRAILGDAAEKSEAFAVLLPPLRDVAAASAPEAPEAAPVPATERKASAEHVDVMITYAEDWQGDIPSSNREFNIPQKAEEFRTDYKNSIWWTVAARMYAADLPEGTDQEKAQKDSFMKRIKKLEFYFSQNRKTFAATFDRKGTLKDALNSMEAGYKGKLKDGDKVFPEGSLINPSTNKPVRIRLRPPGAKADLEKPGTPQTAQGAPTPVNAESSDRALEIGGYRCMYAGFILRKEPCRAPQTLPEGSKLDLFDDSFRCLDSETMCNPLLYGVRDSRCDTKTAKDAAALKTCLKGAKPVCLPKSPSATKDCATSTNSDEALSLAAAIIGAQPDAWNEFRTSFYELCDDKMIAFNGFVEDKAEREAQKNGANDGSGEGAKKMWGKALKAVGDAMQSTSHSIDRKLGIPIPYQSSEVRKDVENTCEIARARLKTLAEKNRVVIDRPSTQKAEPAKAEPPASGGRK